MSEMKWGIDGCKAGWLAIQIDGNNFRFGVFKTLFELQTKFPETNSALIDIPIGLSSRGFTRTLESKMRKELLRKASSVFPTPSREALSMPSYKSASEVNFKVLGKKLTQQTYAIMPKIAEADKFDQTSGFELIESHPEICFKYLNRGKVVSSSKKKLEGQNERLDILSKYNPRIRDRYQKVLKQTLRKHVARDDIIDAMCLSVCVENGELSFLKDENSIDECGKPIRIAYYKP